MKAICFVLIFFTSFLYSQNNYLKGTVYEADVPQTNITITNIKTGKFWKTNDKGEFTIEVVSTNDIVIFTRTDLEDYILNLNSVHDKEELRVFMAKKTILLQEITIKDYSKINPVSLGIVPKNQKTYTPAERKLRTAGDFKPIHLLGLLGGTFPLDPVLNKINGRTKQLKKNVEVEKKEIHVKLLKENYHDFLVELKLTEVEEDSFLYYLVEDSKFREQFNSQNVNQMKFFICDVLMRYKKENIPNGGNKIKELNQGTKE